MAPKNRPGIYFLIIKLRRSLDIEIGKLGTIHFKPGYYIYVGSAYGSGGVAARVKRHLSKEKKLHWHIDYLLESERGGVFVVEVLILPTVTRNEECDAAQHLAKLLDEIPGFGCSDCGCGSHLFHGKRFGDTVEAVRSYSDEIELYTKNEHH